MSKDVRKNKISSKGDVGKYNKGTKKDVEWHCEGHHVHKKKFNLNLCSYIKKNYRFKKAFIKLPLDGTPRRF
jgi:hypothetical protein